MRACPEKSPDIPANLRQDSEIRSEKYTSASRSKYIHLCIQ